VLIAATREDARAGEPPPEPAARGPQRETVAEPSDAGTALLRELRQAGFVGDYHLHFLLRVQPRRGRERVFRGELWGSRNAEGPISRIVLYGEGGAEGNRAAPSAAASQPRAPLRALLIQNGPAPRIWSWEPDAAQAALLPERDWHAPLIAGAQISAFDLLMPYLYWEDFALERPAKILGRSADTFLLRSPDGAATGVAAVRAYFDQQFHALLQSKLMDADGAVVKTLTVRDLQKVSGQWMLKSIDLRDEATRDKTRFEVQDAALGLDFPAQLFAPEALGEPLQ